MTLSKFTDTPNGREITTKIDDIVDALGNKQDTLVSGTNIKTINNESVLGSGNISISGGGSVDQTYDGTSTNAQSGVAIESAGFIKNTATGNNGLTVGGTASTVGGATNLGKSSIANKAYSTAVGYNSQAKGNYSTTVGWNAMATKQNAIQIGHGTNTTENSLSIGFYNQNNYQLLNGTTGKIPNDRLDMDTTPTSASTKPITSGAVYTALGDIETILHNLNSGSGVQ